jgi:hypothetical protein
MDGSHRGNWAKLLLGFPNNCKLLQLCNPLLTKRSKKGKFGSGNDVMRTWAAGVVVVPRERPAALIVLNLERVRLGLGAEGKLWLLRGTVGETEMPGPALLVYVHPGREILAFL